MLRLALLSFLLLVTGCGESGPVKVVVHGDRPDQVWEGFGACASTWSGVEVWSGPAARLDHSIRPNAPVPQALRDEAMRIVLEEFRLNVFYAGALSEPVNDNDDPCVSDPTRFAFGGSDFGNGRAYSGLDEYVDDWVLPSRALPSRPEIEFHFTLYMNGRCAPDWLERLGGTDVYEAIDRGLDPGHVVEVAEHLATMVQHWTKRTGRAPQHIGLFNEPGGKENVGGPVLRACALVLGRRLAASGLPTRIVLADAIVSEGHAGTIKALLDSEEARRYIGAVSYHRYVEEKHLFENIAVCREAVDDGERLIEKPVSYAPKALAAGMGVRLTETMFYQPDDVSEHGRLRTVCLFDEINFGRATACYGIGSAFYQSDPGVAGNIGKTGPAATMVYDEKTKLFTGVEIAPSWQWLGLLSSSVRPGSRRLESECDDDKVRSLAFSDRNDGRLVLLLLNPGDDDREVETSLRDLADARNTSRTRTSGSKKGGIAEARATLDPVEVRDGRIQDRLPARSLTAYEFATATMPSAVILAPNEFDG